MHYLVLTTGSCGNCYIFNEGDETVIIDCGVTYKKLSECMAMHSIPKESISAMFLTHLHPDHSKGVGTFMRKTGLPVFLSDRSHKALRSVIQKQKIEYEKLHTFRHGDEISIGCFRIVPFMTYHDSEGSSGYFIRTDSSSAFVLTDSGMIPPEAFAYAREADVKFIEANYDASMLDNGPYAEWLKARVRGSYGHLDNRDAVDFAARTSRHGDHVYFVHLSDNNNRSVIVRDLAYKAMPSGIFIRVLERGEETEGYINE